MTTRAVRDGDHYVLTGRRRGSRTPASPSSTPSSPRPTPTPATGGSARSWWRRTTPGLLDRQARAQDGDARARRPARSCSTTSRSPPRTSSARRAAGFGYAMGALDCVRARSSARRPSASPRARSTTPRDYVHRAAPVRPADRRVPGRAVHARRHGDAGRGGAAARVRGRCRVDAGAPGVSQASSMAKLFASDTAMRVTTDAVQLLGGAGYTPRLPGRADDARRQGHPDLRGHEPDPAHRDRPQAPRRAPGAEPYEPGMPARTLAVMADAPRVRFSPAPTGSLHVGSAPHRAVQLAVRPPPRRHVRAAHRGHRRRPLAREWVVGIQDTLRWLGLDWDEGPVLQSDRASTEYHAAADRLLADGPAYECFCTEDEVKARNEAARAAGRPPGYDGHCRDLSAGAARRPAPPRGGRGRSGSARPTSGVSRFVDSIRGEVSVEWSTISDFVIVRSDGSPIFFLANAVDDLEMGITHVIRGEDLLDSTHRVLALRDALGGADRPVYAHLPLIVGRRPGQALEAPRRRRARGVPRRRATSPRRWSTTSRCSGWAPEDGREVMDLDEIVAAFELERVTHARRRLRPPEARLDERRVDPAPRRSTSSSARALPLAEARFGDRLDLERLPRARSRIGQERAVTLVGAGRADGLPLRRRRRVRRSIPSRGSASRRPNGVGEVLDAVIAHLEALRVDRSRRSTSAPSLEALGLKPRKAMPALYAAVEGATRGPAALRLDRAARTRAHTGAAARCTRAARRRPVTDQLEARATAWASSSLLAAVLYYVVTFVQVWRAARRRRHPTVARRSSCSAPRSTTAGRRRCSGPASTTPPTSTHERHRTARSSSPAASRRRPVHGGGRGRRLSARARRARRGDPPRDDEPQLVGVARRGSARFLDNRTRIDRVVLVSDPFHSLRIRLIAEELGFDAVTSPTRTSPITGVDEWRRFLSEALRVAHRAHRRRSGAWRGLPIGWGSSCRDSLPGRTFGGGVIGNTTGSGPVIGGSSPPPRARTRPGHRQRCTASLAPSSSGLGRRPLKAETAVRICSGLQLMTDVLEPGHDGRALAFLLVSGGSRRVHHSTRG